MNIDRHNYEEFFLMYVDNELQQDERREVESFVQQNPDLADELSMLQQATLGNENIEFTGKDLLYRKEEGISMSNYEEYFVLSVDDELNKHQSEDVEKFVLKHPELQEEFTLIQKTKLEPEQIVCPDKESLYKSEKVRRLVPIMWMRMGVAAAVIGIIATLWMFNDNGGNSNNGIKGVIASNNNHEARVDKKLIEKSADKTVTQLPVESLQTKATNKGDQQLASAPGKAKISREKSNITSAKEKIKTQPEPTAGPVLVAQKAAPVQKLAIEEPKNMAVNNARSNESIAVVQEKNNASIAVTAKNTAIEDNAAIVSNAAYREVDTNEDDRKVYIGGAAFNKNKIKGLFKKAAALFGKNVSKDDEDKTVNVAGFQIKGI